MFFELSMRTSDFALYKALELQMEQMKTKQTREKREFIWILFFSEEQNYRE